MDIYDLVKECPLLIRQLIYQYLPQVRYKSLGYVILQVMNNANTAIKFSAHGLLSADDCRKIRDFSNDDVNGGGNGVIRKVLFFDYGRNIISLTHKDFFQITVEKITEDPHEIASNLTIRRNILYDRTIIENILSHINRWTWALYL